MSTGGKECVLVCSTVGEYHPERHASYTMYSVQNDPESHGVLQRKTRPTKEINVTVYYRGLMSLMSWHAIEDY